LGVILKGLDRLNEAEVSYRQAITLKPDYAEAHYNLGVMLQEHGRLNEAEASYTQAITLKPDFVDGARNLVRLPVGQLDSDTLDLCEKIFRVPGDELEHKIKYFFFRGYLLKHRGLMDQSFNNFCKANKLKLEDSKDKVMVERKQNIDHLVRIKKWVPNIPDLTRDRLKKIFIMGPSRSGKSYAEHVLRGSSNVKALYESIRNTEILKNNYYEKDLCERLFQNLFSQSEAQLFHQQYKVVTSTSPESIFYSDYLMDMLPNTYFIIVKRDPRDVSSEIFTKEYLRENLYSHDPNDISKYLGVYNEICETVSLKIPNRFLTVNFEEIIKAPADFVDRVSNLVETKFEVKHLKRNIDSFKPESAFRNYYADMNKELNEITRNLHNL
jgi:tetratricopeptide (TPR) repeat protein